MKLGLQDCLYLGNLDAKRDWGHARDYVEMQWLMLQQDEPQDFVIVTGHQHAVREFVNAAAEEMGMALTWRGKGVDESGFDGRGRRVVAVDPRYFRPTEVSSLLGDASKARDKLGWKPKASFKELVAEMVAADLKNAERDKILHTSGHRVYGRQE